MASPATTRLRQNITLGNDTVSQAVGWTPDIRTLECLLGEQRLGPRRTERNLPWE